VFGLGERQKRSPFPPRVKNVLEAWVGNRQALSPMLARLEKDPRIDRFSLDTKKRILLFTTPLAIRKPSWNKEKIAGVYKIRINMYQQNMDAPIRILNLTQHSNFHDSPTINDTFPCWGNIEDDLLQDLSSHRIDELCIDLLDYIQSPNDKNGFLLNGWDTWFEHASPAGSRQSFFDPPTASIGMMDDRMDERTLSNLPRNPHTTLLRWRRQGGIIFNNVLRDVFGMATGTSHPQSFYEHIFYEYLNNLENYYPLFFSVVRVETRGNEYIIEFLQEGGRERVFCFAIPCREAEMEYQPPCTYVLSQREYDAIRRWIENYPRFFGTIQEFDDAQQYTTQQHQALRAEQVAHARQTLERLSGYTVTWQVTSSYPSSSYSGTFSTSTTMELSR